MCCQREIVGSIFLGWKIMINCNPFIVFFMSLECVKGVFYCPRQRPKFRSRKNQVQNKKTRFCHFDTSRHLARPIKTVTLTPVDTSLIDQDCDISKNLKYKKAHNLLISSLIHDPSVVLFKGYHKLSLVRNFRERNHRMCG